ncbi:MAG: hypothetical protein ONA69_08795 [candidate division KSB1 bacterium]|nr:hypothetical protein [candidate division KSB1 bacterium]MDZ7346873.1 hypothetical protein [candidate division KSB1 bacterium]
MSIFEIIMLLCFGLAWPFSIYKTYTARRNEGKSVIFLYAVLVGYASGVIHKLLYSLDAVIALYSLNGFMVLIDILLYHRNERLQKNSR